MVSFGGGQVSENPSDANTWFAVLRAAKAAGDRDLERMAREQLEALGYRVVFQRPKPATHAQQGATP